MSFFLKIKASEYLELCKKLEEAFTKSSKLNDKNFFDRISNKTLDQFLVDDGATSSTQ